MRASRWQIAAGLGGAPLSAGAIGVGAAPASVRPPTIFARTLHVVVSPTNAQITGEVNPNGSLTTVLVRYGKTPAYGATTGPARVGSGSVAVVVHVSIGGIRLNTIDRAQLVVTNAGGRVTSGDVSFSLRAAPSVPVQ